MRVPAFLLQQATEHVAQRPEDHSEDVHFTESLAEWVIDATTAPGDRVLDPFAGYGTTLAVAERLGRQAVGVDLLQERVDQTLARTSGDARVVRGDSRRLSELVEGPFDLVLTSPPYMASVAHPENPLRGYATDDGHYPHYLDELGEVFDQVAALLRPGGHAVVNVANVVQGEHVTLLAWDLGQVVARRLTFVGETFLCWDTHPAGLTGDYLLWFRRDGMRDVEPGPAAAGTVGP